MVIGPRRIEEVEEIGGALPRSRQDVVLFPAFVNAHSHMGDAFIERVPPGLSVAQLVGPKNGLKSRMLASTVPSVKASGMAIYLRAARAAGISRTIDFREEGVPGMRMARDAVTGLESSGEPPLRPFLLARPAEGETLRSVIREADGLGLSSARDVPPGTAGRWAAQAHRAGKPLALHVSEGRREDIAAVLRLRPSLLVHLCRASRSDLEQVASARVPVAVCPRSNAYFGLKSPVRAMLDLGIRVCLGTDNAMLATPDLLEEARLLAADKRAQVSAKEAIAAAILASQNLLLPRVEEGMQAGSRGELLVVKLSRPTLERVLRLRLSTHPHGHLGPFRTIGPPGGPERRSRR